MADSLPHLRSQALGAIPHGFFGRAGGASEGVVEGLNCGWGANDNPDLVAENRRRAAHAVLPGASIVSVHQVHSPTALVVEQPWRDQARPAGDALVSATPRIILGIVTADCAPVLLADEDAGVIGAAHAGWRGANSGIIEATVAAMERLGATTANIGAAIGPTIAQESYEVDDSFRANFASEDDHFFVSGRAGHWHFDLPAYVASRLRQCGIDRIDDLAIDTYADDSAYYSFRRATHRREPTYGRQISLIALG